MVDTILDNISLRTQRRADLKIELASTNTPYLVQEFLERVRVILRHNSIQQSSVTLGDIKSNRIVVEIDYYTDSLPIVEFNTIREAVNMEILQAAHTLGLSWPVE
jgi:MscS family membrane protein